MTTYSTQNPLGSSDPRDLYDNAENLDNFVNGAQPAYDDRLGQARKSWAGMEQDFADFLSASGYQFVGDYAAGIELTGYQQILRDASGEFWRLSGSITLPYTTTGAGLPEGGAFVAVGDAVLRQELAGTPVSGQGAALVNGATIYVGSVAEGIAGLVGLNGARYQANEWNNGTLKGGQSLVYSASAPKSGHGLYGWSPTVPPVSAQGGATLVDRIENYLAGTGETDVGGSGLFLMRKDSILNPYMFGALGGSNDDTAPFLSLAAAVVEKQKVSTLGFEFSVRTGEISFLNTPRLHVDFAGSTINEIGTQGDTFTFDNCANLKVHGADFVSTETFASWQASTVANRYYFIRVQNSVRPKVYDINGEAKRACVIAHQCARPKVYDVDHAGFFPDLDIDTDPSGNQCPAVEISGGSYAKVFNVHAQDHGSAVLVGLESKAPTIFAITGDNIHDNVVYVSSGRRSRVFGVDGQKVKGQFVKVRGSLNIVFGSSGEDSQSSAFGVSGNGATADAYGANGHGNILALCNGENLGASGVDSGEQDGLYARDTNISLTTFEKLTSTAGFAAVRSTQQRGGMYVGNQAADTATSHAFLITKPASATNVALPVILGNVSAGHTGPSDAFRLQDLSRAVVMANNGDPSGALVGVVRCDDSAFIGNINIDGTRAVSFDAASERNIILAQRGSTGAPTGSLNGIMDGYPTSGQEPVANTPAYLGQRSVLGGKAYIATGISSPADWKEIQFV